MDNKYIITSSGTFISTDELYHHGILGMKWGVRRYQNADGSLTAAGKKRYTNPDGSLNEKGKKKFGNSVATAEKVETASKSSSDDSAAKRASEMTDAELQNRVNRLRNEDAYKDLSKKLGYDSPKTELDVQIANMEKQKRYLELQRDIKNLTPEKVSRGKKLMRTLMNKVVEPAATAAGKKILEEYLTKAGMDVVGKKLKKETDKIDDMVKKSKEKVEAKQAKKEAKEAEKQAAKEAKKAEKQAKKESEKVYEGTVEGTGSSSRQTSSQSSKSNSNTVIDMEPWPALNAPASNAASSKNTSSGKSYVSGYLNAPVSSLPSPNIAGYLPAPKDDDD